MYCNTSCGFMETKPKWAGYIDYKIEIRKNSSLFRSVAC